MSVKARLRSAGFAAARPRPAAHAVKNEMAGAINDGRGDVNQRADSFGRAPWHNGVASALRVFDERGEKGKSK